MQYLRSIFFILVLFGCLPAKAGVSAETDGRAIKDKPSSKYSLERVIGIRISGKIEKKTAEDFKYWLDFLGNPDTVILNSEGGDVDAALEIGRLIRKNQMKVYVDGECFSSCFFIFIGSVDRYAYYITLNRKKGEDPHQDGKIGLHRPYFNAQEPSAVVGQNDIKNMYQKILSYFEEMNISNDVFQVMMNTPPEKIKIFEFDGIFEYLPKIDVIYDEQLTFSDSIKYGISTSEVRNRRRLSDEKCRAEPYRQKRLSSLDCNSAIMWGLTENLFQVRIKIAADKCRNAISQVDKERLSKLTYLDKFNDRAFRDQIECRKKAMKGDFDWGKDDPIKGWEEFPAVKQ